VSFTLATLKAAIQDFTQNTETTFVDQLDTFIKLAEEKINYTVQIANYNTKSKTGYLAASGSSVTEADAETAPLAPIYFKVRPRLAVTCAIENVSATVTPVSMTGIVEGATVEGDGIAEGTTVSVVGVSTITLSEDAEDTEPSAALTFGVPSNAWSYLLLKDYNFLQEYAPVDSTTGTPKYYAFYNDAQDTDPLNAGTFAFAPISSGSFDYDVLYFFEPTSLTELVSGEGETTAVTWLSTHATNTLLYGSLIEAYTFMKGEADLIQLYDAKYKEALQTLVSTEQGNYRTSFRDRQRAA